MLNQNAIIMPEGLEGMKTDELAKSRWKPEFVIPAKAGIQCS
jgi:hypothetical protein